MGKHKPGRTKVSEVCRQATRREMAEQARNKRKVAAARRVGK